MQSDTHWISPTELAATAPIDPGAFLRWGAQLAREDGKFELSRGKVTGRSHGESSAHAQVCVNIFRALAETVDRKHFDVGLTDCAVRTRFGIRSPDVLVDSGERLLTDLSAAAPVFAAEVLSPSSTGTDFTEKIEEYTAIETLHTYLICSQDEPRAWVWVRQPDGSWPNQPTELAGREGAIALGGLGVEFGMAAVFRGIPDAPAAE